MSGIISEKELELCVEEAKRLSKLLNEKSDKIRAVEKLFRENSMYFTFSKFLTIEDDQDIFLSWELDERIRQSFRIYLIKISDNGTPSFKRVFIETNLVDRLKYIVFLDSFVEDFTYHLKQLQQSF